METVLKIVAEEGADGIYFILYTKKTISIFSAKGTGDIVKRK
jgi:hypothetical protein